ncbi:MAG: aldolase/citrate lyase family protein [Gammaproteobacteria bacterium]|nr:aldolase/citrate lyase family protein [Gammaproteobacteria bacterium]
MKHHHIKQRLAAGERLNGCWIEMYHPVASEIIAMSGYDIAFIDLEHGPGSYADALSVMQVIRAFPCAPMVRVGSSDLVDIKRTLDIGPEGIMVPNIRTADEARQVVNACRYGPDGLRGAAPGIIRATDYGTDVEDYLRFMAEDFLLIIQIESRQAVGNIEQIVQVEGIDMCFVGPSDLSASLGAIGNFESPEYRDAYARIIGAVQAAGKFLGIVPVPGCSLKQQYQDGHNLILGDADTLLLKQAAAGNLEKIRRAAASIRP